MLFGHQETLGTTSLKELKGLVEEFGQVKDRRDEIAAEDKALTATEKELNTKIQAILKEAGLDGFEVPGVGKIYKIEKFYASLPSTDAEWDALFKFLEAEKREDLITVNSQSLTSFYKERMERALEEGQPEFQMPGVSSTGIRVNLGFRRSK